MINKIPPAEIHFRGEAEILPYDDEEAKRLYKKVLNYELPEDVGQDSVWIKIKLASVI